jgi:transcriptional regulator with XRE-family HTH domain
MHGQFVDVLVTMSKLKQERLRAGLSLADVSKRSGIDSAALSRLENGQQPNPTLDTLYRYAAAVGKQIVWSFRNAQPRSARANHKRLPAKAVV